MGKKTAYKNELLLDIIEEILPKNAIHWEQVCETYRERANEDDVRDVDSVKRHFNEKLCNKHQKPTGEARAKAMVERAQTLCKRLLMKAMQSYTVVNKTQTTRTKTTTKTRAMGRIVG